MLRSSSVEVANQFGGHISNFLLEKVDSDLIIYIEFLNINSLMPSITIWCNKIYHKIGQKLMH